MPSRTPDLTELLRTLTQAARLAGYNDQRWAAAAGIRKETLSRIRRKASCDFTTLEALADAVGMSVQAVQGTAHQHGSSRHTPSRWDRAAESRVLALCASGNLTDEAWRAAGPAFFMAGIAVMLASAPDMPRDKLLDLAEGLHPGMTRPDVFKLWLERSPLRPARFMPAFRARVASQYFA